jgi:hypothetical protein
MTSTLLTISSCTAGGGMSGYRSSTGDHVPSRENVSGANHTND